MMPENELLRMLERHKLIRVSCNEDWGAAVLHEYDELLKGSGNAVVADARCPVAAELAASARRELRVADIEPILIHCARELARRDDISDGDKLITTPCRALADMGNSLKLESTRFAAWNDFLSELGEPIYPAPDASPIPLGFFRSLPYDIISSSGREEIENCLAGNEWKKAKLIELLYCRQGCHRGDGVVTSD